MMCSGPENPSRARSALSAPIRPAHGSTVFFMFVSFPAVTAPGQNVLEARDKRGRVAFATTLATGRVCHGGHCPVMLQQNLRVILLATAQRATYGIEPK